MDDVRENFQAVDDPRARASEIRGAVGGKDLVIADCRQTVRSGKAGKDPAFAGGALDVEPAAGQHDDFRGEIEDVLPDDARGRPATYRQAVGTSGSLDPLPHPV